MALTSNFAPMSLDGEDEVLVVRHKYDKGWLSELRTDSQGTHVFNGAGTLIKVKFICGGSQHDFANVTEEIAADASLYVSSETPFDRIIAFVWDDSSNSEHHHELHGWPRENQMHCRGRGGVAPRQNGAER